jgi:Ni/Co efflux regulator RcnB
MEKTMLKTLMTGALALSLLGGATAASADSLHPRSVPVADLFDHRDHDRFDGRRFDRDDYRRGDRDDYRRWDRDDYRYGWNHRWVRGERFYPVYGRSFVVNDWYRYQLHRPPYGYHWVRYGDDFLLVAIGTGIIADLILNSYY